MPRSVLPQDGQFAFGPADRDDDAPERSDDSGDKDSTAWNGEFQYHHPLELCACPCVRVCVKPAHYNSRENIIIL